MGHPMATDIAFALGVLALLGDRIPAGLRGLLAALAIVDDLGAVLIIALFYSTGISGAALVAAGAIFTVLTICNLAGVRHPVIYAALGVALWLAVLSSGVHATIAGVLLAVAIPSRTKINEDTFVLRAEAALFEFQRACAPNTSTVLSNPDQQEALHNLERVVEAVQSPRRGGAPHVAVEDPHRRRPAMRKLRLGRTSPYFCCSSRSRRWRQYRNGTGYSSHCSWCWRYCRCAPIPSNRAVRPSDVAKSCETGTPERSARPPRGCRA